MRADPAGCREVLPAGRVAVDRGLVEGRVRVRREHVLGEHVAVRLGEVEVERRQRPQPAQHAAQVVGERRQLVGGRLGVGRRRSSPSATARPTKSASQRRNSAPRSSRLAAICTTVCR